MLASESNPNHPVAVLLIAHGSRRAEANADLVELARMVAARSDYEIVEAAYLEIAEPTIPAGARRCVERGAGIVLLMPFFLSAGSHVTEDLERFRRELAAGFPGVDFQLRKPLGLHPGIVDVVLDRLRGV
jgi:sirohydrochlorin ferrochelatase